MNSFEEKLYFASITIIDIVAAKIRIVVSLINTIDLGYIMRFENIFSTVVSVRLRLKID